MIPKIKFKDNREETCPASSAFSLSGRCDTVEGMPDLNSGPTSSKARLSVWNLARTASRRAVLPYRNLSIPTRLFSVALGALWTWDSLWNLAKHPT